ncbi:hypothetical protein AVEN_116805-1 [Araneus ventricosus]|uniref:Uncharacterized protein n=1 Tax=Araneus ventricosus TaxID=182803 RepID=A0A4Y2KU59_ARAVE|nr:hypothetical protein AVEN_116805-1 [Araneus ventricosus]
MPKLGDTVASSQLWSQRFPGSKPDSAEDLPCMWACYILRGLFSYPRLGWVPHVNNRTQPNRGYQNRLLNHTQGGQKSSRWCGRKVWRRAASSGVVHVIPTAVQIEEVRLQIALVLLQNGTLI